ncbi:5725_t:CDS:2 [Ambispora leptoticha]|uniref:5725_t:CDS:1 n=1 Tax=Ambispora leptoticha TaxID=144679 RepID=A0A9N9FFR1_9GLOM|nr:5725_t:CDS:2 [Ambispora leptoticha]
MENLSEILGAVVFYQDNFNFIKTNSDAVNILKRLGSAKHEIVSSIPSLSEETRLDVERFDRTIGQLVEFSKDNINDVVPVLGTLFDMMPTVHFTEDGDFCITLRPVEDVESNSTWASLLVNILNLMIEDRGDGFIVGNFIEQQISSFPVFAQLIMMIHCLVQLKRSYQSTTINCISFENKQRMIIELCLMDTYIDAICDALSNETMIDMQALKLNLRHLVNKIEDFASLLEKVDKDLDDELHGIRARRRNWTVGFAVSTAVTATAAIYLRSNWQTLSRINKTLAGGIAFAGAGATAGCVFMREDLLQSMKIHKKVQELLCEFGRELDNMGKCADFNLRTQESSFQYRKTILISAFNRFKAKIDEIRFIGELNLLEQIPNTK